MAQQADPEPDNVEEDNAANDQVVADTQDEPANIESDDVPEPKDQPAEPADEVKEEAPPKPEEPAAEPVKKKKKKRGKKKGDGNPALAAWQKISAKDQSEINWYLMKLAGKVGATTDLEFVAEGNGGAKEIVEFLTDKKKEIYFGLLMCVTTDDAQSVRGKFIYLQVIGSGVKMMQKAKLTPSMGKIDDNFPCKHLTLRLSEDCSNDLDPTKLATELLRVGGAHKPDKMSFGPDQDVDVKAL